MPNSTAMLTKSAVPQAEARSSLPAATSSRTFGVNSTSRSYLLG